MFELICLVAAAIAIAAILRWRFGKRLTSNLVITAMMLIFAAESSGFIEANSNWFMIALNFIIAIHIAHRAWEKPHE